MNTLLASVKELVRQDLLAVDAVIRASMKSSVALVDQVAEHIISGGGKRLRPLIVLLAAGVATLACAWVLRRRLARQGLALGRT